MKLSGATIIGSGNNRRAFDFYPTPREVTTALLDFFSWDRMTIWEPACGDGAMATVLEDYGHNVVSSDLREDVSGEGGVNFLESFERCDAIISNPPFNVSADFIAHALGQSDIVAMLLKSQYWHAKKRYSLFMDNPPAYILPLTWRPNFSEKVKGSPTMDFQWTVWIKDNNVSQYIPLKKPA